MTRASSPGCLVASPTGRFMLHSNPAKRKLDIFMQKAYKAAVNLPSFTPTHKALGLGTHNAFVFNLHPQLNIQGHDTNTSRHASPEPHIHKSSASYLSNPETPNSQQDRRLAHVGALQRRLDTTQLGRRTTTVAPESTPIATTAVTYYEIFPTTAEYIAIVHATSTHRSPHGKHRQQLFTIYRLSPGPHILLQKRKSPCSNSNSAKTSLTSIRNNKIFPCSHWPFGERRSPCCSPREAQRGVTSDLLPESSIMENVITNLLATH